MFLTLSGETGAHLFEALSGEAEALRHESGLDLRFAIGRPEPFKGSIAVRHGADPARPEADGRAWLMSAANRLVTLPRPLAAALAPVTA